MGDVNEYNGGGDQVVLKIPEILGKSLTPFIGHT
jgi:hypothetical protein